MRSRSSVRAGVNTAPIQEFRVDSKHRLNELRRRLRELRVFNEIGKTLTSTLDLKEVLEIIMEKISALLQPKNWALLLTDEESNDLFFEIVVGEVSEKNKNHRLKIGEGISGLVAQTGEPLLISNTSKDSRFSKQILTFHGRGPNSILCAPLVSKGNILGVIELINRRESGGFQPDDLTVLTTLADYAAIAIENARYVQRIQELSITDDVTGLYNSRHLHTILSREVARSKRHKLQFTLVFLDLDFFKRVNDTHGHLMGSRVLKETADVIRRMLRESDVAIRYGGDEFVLLLPETSKKGALILVRRLRLAVNKNRFLRDKGLNIRITASYGIAEYPSDTTNKLHLIKLADQAMYRVKMSGRNNIALA